MAAQVREGAEATCRSGSIILWRLSHQDWIPWWIWIWGRKEVSQGWLHGLWLDQIKEICHPDWVRAGCGKSKFHQGWRRSEVWKCQTGSGRVNWLYLLNFGGYLLPWDWVTPPREWVVVSKNRGHGGGIPGHFNIKNSARRTASSGGQEREPLSQRKPRETAYQEKERSTIANVAKSSNRTHCIHLKISAYSDVLTTENLNTFLVGERLPLWGWPVLRSAQLGACLW